MFSLFLCLHSSIVLVLTVILYVFVSSIVVFSRFSLRCVFRAVAVAVVVVGVEWTKTETDRHRHVLLSCFSFWKNLHFFDLVPSSSFLDHFFLILFFLIFWRMRFLNVVFFHLWFRTQNFSVLSWNLEEKTKNLELGTWNFWVLSSERIPMKLFELVTVSTLREKKYEKKTSEKWQTRDKRNTIGKQWKNKNTNNKWETWTCGKHEHLELISSKFWVLTSTVYVASSTFFVPFQVRTLNFQQVLTVVAWR